MLAAIILTHRVGSKEDIAPGKHECKKCYGDKNRLIALEEHRLLIQAPLTPVAKSANGPRQQILVVSEAAIPPAMRWR